MKSEVMGKVCTVCDRRLPLNMYRSRQKNYVRQYGDVCKLCLEKEEESERER